MIDIRFKDLLNESSEIVRRMLKNEIVKRFAMFEERTCLINFEC